MISPQVDLTNSFTALYLWYDALSKSMISRPYSWRSSLRNSTNVSEFVRSTAFTWILSRPSAPNSLTALVEKPGAYLVAALGLTPPVSWRCPAHDACLVYCQHRVPVPGHAQDRPFHPFLEHVLLLCRGGLARHRPRLGVRKAEAAQDPPQRAGSGVLAGSPS